LKLTNIAIYHAIVRFYPCEYSAHLLINQIRYDSSSSSRESGGGADAGIQLPHQLWSTVATAAASAIATLRCIFVSNGDSQDREIKGVTRGSVPVWL